MSEPRLNPFPCFPVCPRDKLLETEQLLEDAICNKIEVLMAKKLLDFDRNDYYRSLKFGREKGDLAFRSDWNCEVKRYEATPLLTFFKPFSTFYPTWTLKNPAPNPYLTAVRFCGSIVTVIEIFGLEMAVPKKKTSKSRRGMRRAHDFDTPANVVICSNCGKAVVPHNVCKFCNTYAGRNTKVANISDE